MHKVVLKNDVGPVSAINFVMDKLDPGERSPNEPSVLVSPEETLIHWNLNSECGLKYSVDDHVLATFAADMLKLGWARVEFHGQQALLVADIRIRQP